MEVGRSAFKILIGKPSGKRPRRRWEDNIRMNLEEIGINASNWVDSACKDIGLAVNTGETKYMEIGRHRGMVADRKSVV